MRTIAVLSRKGGAGKTTVTLSLALAARQAGLRVVVADIDPLRSSAEVLRGHPEASSLLVETTAKKLPLLQDACISSKCDLLVIDTAPAPESDVILAIDAADICLAVARPTTLDLAAVQQTVALLRERKARGLLVLNQCPHPRNGEEVDLVQRAEQALSFGGVPLASSKLRSRTAYQQAFAHNRSVTEWDPSGEAASEVLRLLAEVEEMLDSPELGSERLAKIRNRLRETPAATPLRMMQDLLRRVTPAAIAR
jgi:chromosome partitioning protein